MGIWGDELSAPVADDIVVVVTQHYELDLAALKASGYAFNCIGTIAGADGK